ncbi:MAG: SLC13 family permease [Acidimicrobiia bacterium]|nr:SLC13 family permease [Acidimicrobiia bacterium]
MSDMTITFLILGVTIVLFIWGRWPPDLVAIGSLLALHLFGVVDLGEAFSGFANATVVLIASLFVVGEGLSRTGATAYFGDKLIGAARGNAPRLLVLSMAATAILSGFVSNTGTVATLMPAVVLASWGVRKVPSAYLIPVAFAANAGGLLTLTGTPPNIVVTDALGAAGFREFGFFEFALIGLPLLIVGVVYMATIGRRLLPARRSGDAPPVLDQEMDELAELYSLNGELFRMRVRKPSPLVGSSLRESNIGRRFGISVLQIEPGPGEPNLLEQSLPAPVRERMEAMTAEPPALPDPGRTINYNDVLIVSGTPAQARELEVAMQLGVLPIDDAGQGLGELLSQEIGIAEVLLTPRSSYVGKVVSEGAVGRTFGVVVLGLRRGDRVISTSEPLRFGDALLVRGTWDAIGTIADEQRNFVVVGQPEEIAAQVTELSPKSWLSIGILAAMVALMVTGLVPVVIASMLAAGAMMVTGCLTQTQAYRAVSWSTVILIAAMIPMAVALESTGGAQIIADGLVDSLGALGPIPLLAGVFLVTTAFSQVISNTAAAVLMVPIVLGAAAGLGVSPHPLMMGLAVGASSAFLTPIGTAPNLMVMAPGGYRFTDYAKVGVPLLALFLAVSLILIPIIWPF